jgi:hypothetical protein
MNENKFVRGLPQGIVITGRWRREGHTLHAWAHVQAFGGAPHVVRAELDLRPILRMRLERLKDHFGAATDADLFGFFSFKKLFKSVVDFGKSTIVQTVVDAAKTIVKSKIVGAAVAGLAVVFPPIGLPAAAIYAAGNLAVRALETAETVHDTAKGILESGSPAGKAVVVAKTPQIKQAMKKASFVRRTFSGIAAESKKGNPQAKAMAKAVSLIVRHRKREQKMVASKTKSRTVPASVQAQAGLLVTTRGQILPGSYLAASMMR